MSRIFSTVGALALCALMGGACAFDGRALSGGGGDVNAPSAPDDFAKEYAAKENMTLRVKNASGDVIVRGTDGTGVRVRGIKEGRDRDRVEVIDKSGEGSVDLGVRYNCRNCQADVRFEIEVPRGVRLRFDEISSASGDVKVENVTGDLTAKTASGDVDVTNVTGKIEASSASGDVTVRDAAGAVSAETASGDVDVRIARLAGDGDLEFSTASGNVSVRVPGDTNADVEMRTMSGSVKTDFGLQVNRPQYGPGESAEGRIGGGGRRMKLSTASGDVELSKS